jgi:hypothetical protein
MLASAGSLRASESSFYTFQKADFGLVEGFHEARVSNSVLNSYWLRRQMLNFWSVSSNLSNQSCQVIE